MKHRTPGGLTRIRENLSALVASPDNPILDVVGGWRGVFDAVGPNVVFLVVDLITGVPLAILTTYAQLRVLRHHYAKARTRSGPTSTPSPMLR